MMQRIHITLFTKLDIRRNGQEIPKLPAKAEELLCYLLLYRDQPHTREALACEL
jgi:DNA-binding SARP family transcriptional activator